MMETIEPESPLWSFSSGMVTLRTYFAASRIEKKFDELEEEHYFLMNEGEKYVNFFERFLVDKEYYMRESILNSLIGINRRFKYFDEMDRYHKLLAQEYPESRYLEHIEKDYSPKRKIKPGVKIPEFSFSSLVNDNYKLTNKTMLGKRYIINFWATWCGPCKPVIQAMENFYKLYKKDNFQIINVSMCYKKDDAIEFVKNKIKEKFFNTHLEGWKPNEGVIKDFEVIAIPKTILVDETGTILAVDSLDEIMKILNKSK